MKRMIIAADHRRYENCIHQQGWDVRDCIYINNEEKLMGRDTSEPIYVYDDYWISRDASTAAARAGWRGHEIVYTKEKRR